jgi:hypothetical protein
VGVAGGPLLDVVAANAVPVVAGVAHQLTHARLDAAFEPQAWAAA